MGGLLETVVQRLIISWAVQDDQNKLLITPTYQGKIVQVNSAKAGHASSLRIPREKKCPAGTINEFELHDSSWLWEYVS